MVNIAQSLKQFLKILNQPKIDFGIELTMCMEGNQQPKRTIFGTED